MGFHLGLQRNENIRRVSFAVASSSTKLKQDELVTTKITEVFLISR